jgi:lactate dehydrogenase-like 2-hydroxyacid dehydrogenase
MRERTPLSAALLMQLPNLKLIVSTGAKYRSIDVAAAEKLQIEVHNTR